MNPTRDQLQAPGHQAGVHASEILLQPTQLVGSIVQGEEEAEETGAGGVGGEDGSMITAWEAGIS